MNAIVDTTPYYKRLAFILVSLSIVGATAPLRERLDDIPALTAHFIDQVNRKTGRSVKGVSEKGANKFAAYHWPGNIRELEHLIERSVLLSSGNIIEDIKFPEIEFKREHYSTRISYQDYSGNGT